MFGERIEPDLFNFSWDEFDYERRGERSRKTERLTRLMRYLVVMKASVKP